jgi:hypothetical protein
VNSTDSRDITRVVGPTAPDLFPCLTEHLSMKNAKVLLFALVVGGGCGALLTRGLPGNAIEGFCWGGATSLLILGAAGVLSRVPWMIKLRRHDAPREDYARELDNVFWAGISMVVGVVGFYATLV